MQKQESREVKKEKSEIGDFGKAVGDWSVELRTELDNIRQQASKIKGIESLRLRLLSVEIEIGLMEVLTSLITKNLETLGNILKPEK